MQPIHEAHYLLIVDDDPMVRLLATESLKASGFDVDEAGDGPGALARIEKRQPDLVLLDVMMPGMDGYEVCRVLHERPALAHVPVIMLTGLNDTESIERAYESGATDFICKPINAALLTYRVRYALRASRMVEEIDRHRARLANAQRIARLGSWTWHPSSKRFESSSEYRQIIGARVLDPQYQWRDIVHHVHPDDAERVAQTIEKVSCTGESDPIAYRILCGDGTERTVYEQVEIIRDSAGGVKCIEGTTQDITDRVATEKRIRRLADYDALTELANRRLFSEVARHGLHQRARKKGFAAVLDVNLDRFKRINETLGSAAGDHVLKEVARRLAASVRACDLAGANQDETRNGLSARMNGDGFAVFLAEMRRAEDAALIARRLVDAIAQPMQWDNHDLNMTASVGIAVYPDNGDDVDTLLRHAATAMRSARALGAGRYSFFNPEMNARSLATLELENDLRGAIDRDELVLYYQARVDVPTGRLAGAEALLRWRHPRRGLVPPGEFIPVAEESGLIVPLTAWVVRAACRQLQQWRRTRLAVVPLSINLSAHSFREEGLTALIATSLHEFDIEPHLLECEITESMLMQDVTSAVTRLHELRRVGVELAMDDFGTGYSSLAYLKRFPLNVLKIDRAFIKDVLSDAHDAAIASTILALGKAMGLTVVAEGMEQAEQANFLLSLGCRYMQGFLFARPVPAEVFVESLRDGFVMPSGLHACESALEEPAWSSAGPFVRHAARAHHGLRPGEISGPR